jgi:hypothetical protein
VRTQAALVAVDEPEPLEGVDEEDDEDDEDVDSVFVDDVESFDGESFDADAPPSVFVAAPLSAVAFCLSELARLSVR